MHLPTKTSQIEDAYYTLTGDKCKAPIPKSMSEPPLCNMCKELMCHEPKGYYCINYLSVLVQ